MKQMSNKNDGKDMRKNAPKQSGPNLNHKWVYKNVKIVIIHAKIIIKGHDM